MSKILIVDDAKLMRNMIKNILAERSDNVIVEANNGNDAIETFKVTQPDIVTMDITMDFKNGVDSAKEILKLDPNAKIVMVTALGQEQLLKQCVGLGVKDYIVKPFTKERLLSAIDKALK